MKLEAVHNPYHSDTPLIVDAATKTPVAKMMQLDMATAQMLAAAPELLEALRRAESLIANECRMDAGNQCTLNIVRAAIAKAEGVR